MSQANEAEQLMLMLINEERAAAGLDPLRFNGDLNEAAEDHSDWMLESDVFSHTGEDGSSVRDRAVEAGYTLAGNWAIGENIGWQSERGDPGIEDDVRDIHRGLMESPGHRANILSADYDEIGIGIERGDFQGYDGVVITQNFGATDAAPEPADPPAPAQPPAPAPVDPVDPAPVDPVAPQPQAPFDPDAFIAGLSALLEDLFASLDVAGWHRFRTDDMITFQTVAEDHAVAAPSEVPWECDWSEGGTGASVPTSFDWDFI